MSGFKVPGFHQFHAVNKRIWNAPKGRPHVLHVLQSAFRYNLHEYTMILVCERAIRESTEVRTIHCIRMYLYGMNYEQI